MRIPTTLAGFESVFFSLTAADRPYKKAMPKENRVIVEGVNVQTKHQKQTQKAAAEIKHQEGPIDASNVMYYDTKAKKASRIGYTVEKDGSKVRVSKKTGNVID